MEANPYHPPTIPADQVPRQEWLQHKWPRIVTAIVCGLITCSLTPEAQDAPEMTSRLAVAMFAGGAAAGYVACVVIQVLRSRRRCV